MLAVRSACSRVAGSRIDAQFMSRLLICCIVSADPDADLVHEVPAVPAAVPLRHDELVVACRIHGAGPDAHPAGRNPVEDDPPAAPPEAGLRPGKFRSLPASAGRPVSAAAG